MTDLAAPPSAASRVAYVRTTPVPHVARPPLPSGPLHWVRKNLFATPLSGLLTLLVIAAAWWTIPPLVDFMLIDAVWSGSGRDACLPSAGNPDPGACWAFVRTWFSFFIYGPYPLAERWRVDVFFALLAFGTGWLLWLDAPRRDLGAAFFFLALPTVSFILLRGWPTLGLAVVDTALWGGLLVTLVVASVGIVVSLPIGILLALGRRSAMPAVRLLSIGFIELVRGVPLITVLFMASVMLPLFVPPAWSPDKLLRALVGIAIFASAYMAEVVRAGLASIPKGQYEAARALGLGYWRMLALVVLPQALRVTIPNIVNNYIALFKDTTLVFFVGIFDFLRTIEIARVDPAWATPVTSTTGYAFAAVCYFVACHFMSRYATGIERRLAAGDRR
ncbi:amino acid ABC transporter permease [Rhodoplanes elegans]|uniref:Amino acid ABC transporter permease n=1 Tax=Rhodoplanes elegans TaxID=29408 RepID=A0A327KRP7_9BRAD|nr:amino acid ABC transporter permease [Rhodoplanes elegans]MBK5957136.1 amino acid ABC transporter permease [Rhodoplanes elegans]RAI39962.1 amino acid ABC transporter permease [Rhodoplanes elegans]